MVLFFFSVPGRDFECLSRGRRIGHEPRPARRKTKRGEIRPRPQRPVGIATEDKGPDPSKARIGALIGDATGMKNVPGGLAIHRPSGFDTAIVAMDLATDWETDSEEASGTVANPLEQFTIKPIVPVRLAIVDAFTNSGLFMILAVAAVVGFVFHGMRSKDRFRAAQSMAELGYEFIAGMAKHRLEGRVYFPFVFSLFMFILFGNMLGLIPGAFTFTSHIVVTLAMAAFVFVMVTLIASWQGTDFAFSASSCQAACRRPCCL